MILFNFILLDSARMDDQIDEAKKLNSQYTSLFKNKGEQYLQSVAPYLFQSEVNANFVHWLVKEGRGKSWGIFIKAKRSLEEIQLHFQKFNIAKVEDGKSIYFRYYDPRVLRVFLPNYDIIQLERFFDNIEKIICEDEDPNYALIYSFNGKKLLAERVAANLIF